MIFQAIFYLFGFFSHVEKGLQRFQMWVRLQKTVSQPLRPRPGDVWLRMRAKRQAMLKSDAREDCAKTGRVQVFKKIYIYCIHWAPKETYPFCRATLTKIHRIKINHIYGWPKLSLIVHIGALQIGRVPRVTVHRKLLIKWGVSQPNLMILVLWLLS